MTPEQARNELISLYIQRTYVTNRNTREQELLDILHQHPKLLVDAFAVISLYAQSYDGLSENVTDPEAKTAQKDQNRA